VTPAGDAPEQLARVAVERHGPVGRTLTISGLRAAIPVDETVEAAPAALDRRS